MPSGEAVGNALIRSRAAAIGIRVTVSTAAALRAGLSWSGLTTCWPSTCHSAIRRAGAVIRSGLPSWVKGLAGRVPPRAEKARAAVGAAGSTARP
ncbi:hypothetical protein GCM10025734_76630 [Kitasatospora paranensis]